MKPQTSIHTGIMAQQIIAAEQRNAFAAFCPRGKAMSAIKSYIINMDRNPERLEHMRSAFNKLSLSFERFPAVDGNSLGAEAFEQFKRERPLEHSGNSYTIGARRSWSPASMGCFLSHYRLWQIVAASADPFTAIFEDDVHITDVLRSFLVDDFLDSRGL